jgi:RNA polymerase sigma factor (TIGR02999 family)
MKASLGFPAGVVATDEIFEVAYEELKRIARSHLRGADKRVTLCTTELVHEAFLKLRTSPTYSGRPHFFGAAARAMREVLVDFARSHRAEKRGGMHRQVSLSDAECALEVELDEMLALDAALNLLSDADPRLTQVVELRFFCGLPEREIAGILGVATRTVERSWLKARLFLLKALETGA